jgi:hypothetical protein
VDPKIMHNNSSATSDAATICTLHAAAACPAGHCDLLPDQLLYYKYPPAAIKYLLTDLKSKRAAFAQLDRSV